MRKILISGILTFWSLTGFSQENVAEMIPNSSLVVTFPKNWNSIKPYLGDGKYSSIQVHLPSLEHGGYPEYPEFDFEFIRYDSNDEKLEAIKAIDLPSTIIAGVNSKLFSYEHEARYLHGDMSHSSRSLSSKGYIVPLKSGYLVCTLTTVSKNDDSRKEYQLTLKNYCESSVKSER